MTDEQKIIAAAEAKRQETYRKKREQREAERQEQHARYNDRIQGLAICREIRDRTDATDTDRLMAIQLIKDLTA